jgi:hypothetical protein
MSLLGKELGGYRIESEIGRGGMGIVYLATQTRLERRVALKVITPDQAEDPGFRSRFERESRLAASIDHPNVVPIYEAGEVGSLLYIAMRYVRGTDLKAVLARVGPLQPRRGAEIVGQVGSALDAAHQNGLVHRDVKPANVLLEEITGGERAYLSDFGLTKRLTSTSGVTESGVVVGTLDYIAPEQVRGGSVDARTDVYALACVLFHALSARVPYPREDNMAKMYAHANDAPPSLLELSPGLPPDFEDVIRRGMAKDPVQRYPSAGDLGRAAMAAAEGLAPTFAERSVATGPAAGGAGELAPTRPEEPRPAQIPREELAPTERVPQRSSRLVIVLVAVTLLALGVAAGVLVATGALGGGDEGSPATPPGEREGEPPPDTEPMRPGPEARTTYEPFVSELGGYETVMPASEGWSSPEEQVISDGLFRATATGPGDLEVIIDHTPAEAATFKPADKCRPTSHPGFPLAERCVFEGGSLAPCQRSTCVDYLLNSAEDGPGYGVLVGGGDFAEAQRIAKRIADELVPAPE